MASANWNPRFTDDEVNRFLEFFPTLKTYRAEDDSISSSDIPYFYTELMKWERTKEQLQAYVDFVDYAFGGRMAAAQYRQYLTTQHDKLQLFSVYVHDFDVDKDGFISREEFKVCFETLQKHDPSMAGVSYDKVLMEADVNQDGKLSTEELIEWLKSNTSA